MIHRPIPIKEALINYHIDEYLSGIDCEWKFVVKDFTPSEICSLRSKILSSYYRPAVANFLREFSKETNEPALSNNVRNGWKILLMNTREKMAPALIITFTEGQGKYFSRIQLHLICVIEEGGSATKIKQDNLFVKVFFALDNLVQYLSNKVKMLNKNGGYIFVDTENPRGSINYVLELLGWKQFVIKKKNEKPVYRVFKMFGLCE